MKTVSIEERAVKLAHYIIDNKETVRGAAKEFGVHMDVTQKNGNKIGQAMPNTIEIKGVFLSKRNPVVRLAMVIR